MQLSPPICSMHIEANPLTCSLVDPLVHLSIYCSFEIVLISREKREMRKKQQQYNTIQTTVNYKTDSIKLKQSGNFSKSVLFCSFLFVRHRQPSPSHALSFSILSMTQKQQTEEVEKRTQPKRQRQRQRPRHNKSNNCHEHFMVLCYIYFVMFCCRYRCRCRYCWCCCFCSCL